MLGASTLAAEVTHISAHGIWVLLDNEELPMPYTEFPWFKTATIEQITTLERPTQDHLYWPLLDVDLSVSSVRKPEAFPLISGAGRQPTA